MPEQQRKAPSLGAVGTLARNLANVVVVEQSSDQLRQWQREQCPEPTRFFFIDGDHSDPGVQWDTETVLEYLHTVPPLLSAEYGVPNAEWSTAHSTRRTRHSVGPPVRARVLWHDRHAGAPDWRGVREYLANLRRSLSVVQIEDTRPALLEYGRPRGWLRRAGSCSPGCTQRPSDPSFTFFT